MKTLNDIAAFLEQHILECEVTDGCGQCDDTREAINILKSYGQSQISDEKIKEIEVNAYLMSNDEFMKWYRDKHSPVKADLTEEREALNNIIKSVENGLQQNELNLPMVSILNEIQQIAKELKGETK